jgi:hypothetical protein
MNECLTYNTLPPHTKAAMDVIANMYYKDYLRWRQYYYKTFNTDIQKTGAIQLSTRSDVLYLNEYRKDPILVQDWLKTIEIFELLNDDIREELIPGFSKLPLAKPYPSKCKLCSSPARKCGSVVLCSNDKCKSKKDVRAKYCS